MTAAPARATRLPRFLRALGSRNYRLFFTGQVVSLVGTWMTQTASLWLAYHLESSAFLLGLVGFAGQAPIFVLAPFAGVWVDRLDRRRLLLLTQGLSALQSGVLAVLALTDHVNIWSLVGLNLVQGAINAFDLPARQSFFVQLVDRREDLGNAIALNSTVFNLARLVGPALGGFAIAASNAGTCYAVDAVSYVAVLVSLLFIQPRPQVPSAVAEMVVAADATDANVAEGKELLPPIRAGTALRAGWAYAFGFAPIRALILLVALISFAGFAAPVLMPIFARDIFGGGARTLGTLMSATGLGALAGALFLSTRQGVRGLGDVITVGGVLMGAGLVATACCRTLEPALVGLALVGAGGVLLMAGSNTVLQHLVEDDKRGRVMSLFTMAFTGTTPLGNLVVGALAATSLGAPRTLAVCGVVCLLVVAYFRRQLPRLRAVAAPVLARLEPAEAPPMG